MSNIEIQMQEVVDRVRRLETRVTRFLEAQGFDTGVRRPIWDGNTVHVPSPACSIQDILSVVPADWDPEFSILVKHKGDEVFEFFPPHRKT